MIYRAYNLSSNFLNFHKEIEYLRVYFYNNGFNINTFYSIVGKFLDSIYYSKKVEFGPVKKIVYIRFPFLSDPINKYLSIKLQNININHFLHMHLRLAFYNDHKIRTYFKIKESLPVAMRSSVVYIFTCAKCSLAYIGSTKKMLTLRVDEHRGISSRTGRQLQKPLFSSIREHCQATCDTNFEVKDFKILAKCKTEQELRIAESIFIRIKKPNLNLENSSINLNVFS